MTRTVHLYDTAIDFPSTFFYFCNTCLFLKFRISCDVARRKIFYYIAVWFQSPFATVTFQTRSIPWQSMNLPPLSDNLKISCFVQTQIEEVSVSCKTLCCYSWNILTFTWLRFLISNKCSTGRYREHVQYFCFNTYVRGSCCSSGHLGRSGTPANRRQRPSFFQITCSTDGPTYDRSKINQ